MDLPAHFSRMYYMAQDSQPAVSIESPRICFCYAVSEAEIRAAIAAGALTVAAVQASTQASTGCGGCVSEVERILEEERLSKMSQK